MTWSPSSTSTARPAPLRLTVSSIRVDGDPYKQTDYELVRFRLPAGAQAREPDGDLGIDSVDGFVNPAPIPAHSPTSASTAPSPTTARSASPTQRGNFLEARIAAATTARVELRKWDGSAWSEQGEAEGRKWRWTWREARVARSPARPQRRADGLTLIEIMFASLLFLAVALGVVPMFTQSMVSNASGNDSTKAANFARARAEELTQYPFNHLDLTVEAGSEKVLEEYYTSNDAHWHAYPVPDGKNPEWSRTDHRSPVQRRFPRRRSGRDRRSAACRLRSQLHSPQGDPGERGAGRQFLHQLGQDDHGPHPARALGAAMVDHHHTTALAAPLRRRMRPAPASTDSR